jgi:hypothetical protein
LIWSVDSHSNRGPSIAQNIPSRHSVVPDRSLILYRVIFDVPNMARQVRTIIKIADRPTG